MMIKSHIGFEFGEGIVQVVSLSGCLSVQAYLTLRSWVVVGEFYKKE